MAELMWAVPEVEILSLLIGYMMTRRAPIGYAGPTSVCFGTFYLKGRRMVLYRRAPIGRVLRACLRTLRCIAIRPVYLLLFCFLSSCL